jgi:protein-tyrosine phosphatase
MHPAQVHRCQAEAIGSVPRMVFVPDVPNMRDIGGWRTTNGRQVKQGMIYRSAAFDRKQKWFDFGNRPHVSDETVDFLVKEVGIKTDLDLRSVRETKGMSGSPLGPSIKWLNIPALAYGAIDTPEGRAAFSKMFRVLQDRNNYPIVMHCQFGRDRAGTAVYLINGLLGVPVDSLDYDWELSQTWYGSKRYSKERCLAALVAALQAYPGETFARKVRAYVVSLGFSEAEVESFVDFMTQSGLKDCLEK